MRIASIQLALIVVLGFVSEAGAIGVIDVNDDYSFWRGMQRFGFHDGTTTESDGSIEHWSYVNLGPLDSYQVPFTARQGLIGSFLIPIGLIVLMTLLTVLTVRWKRKPAT